MTDTAPTPDELAAIRARDETRYSIDVTDTPSVRALMDFVATMAHDRHVLLAALDAEQQRRERVEAAARAFLYEGDLTEAEANAIPDDEWSEAALALRAALVTDASEGEPSAS